MKIFVAIVFIFLPLLGSSYHVKIGILSRIRNSNVIKEVWSIGQNFSITIMEPIVERANWRDIGNAAKFSRSICRLVDKDVDVLVYLGSPRWNSLISSYATHLGLPFVAAGVNTAGFGQNQVCMLPDTTEAAADIMIKYGWENFVFFYDSDNGPDQLQEVLSALLSLEFVPRVDGFLKVENVDQVVHYMQNLPLTKRRFLLATSEYFVNLLFSYSFNTSDILLLTPVGTVKNTRLLRNTTLTKFSVEIPEEVVFFQNRLTTTRLGLTKQELDSVILHYDSSLTLDATFNKIAREKPAALKPRNNHGCFQFSEEFPETVGFMQQVNVEQGISGRISFDEKGRRRDYKLNIVQTFPQGDVEKVGSWSDKYGLQMLRETAASSVSPKYAAYKKEFPIKVTSVLTDPFLRENENGTFQGYIVDFLKELSNEIKMDYHLQLVKDGFYGRLVDGKWSGMVGELVRGEADIAIAPLTKSLERQEVIDFSKNIMTSGLNILIKKSEFEMESSTFGPFTFLSIWSAETWIVIVISVAVFSAGSYGISRFIGSPDRVRALESKGTDNLSPCGSVWFTIGSLFCRDTGIYPRYITHRLWALLWWIFCIFIGLLYVAMLTSVLIKVRTTVTTTHSRKTSQEVLKEYVDTGFPVLGAVIAGSTAKLFTKSEIGIYQQVGRLMEDNPDSMTASYSEGIERVRNSNGKYAFIMESASSEFVVNNEPCDTLVTSGYLFTRPYAVAFPKNSTLKDIIDYGILTLKETGKLRELYEKWWHRQASACEDPALNILPKVYHAAMTLHEVSGVFYLFILFSILSVAAAAVEYYIRTRKVTVR